MSDIPSRFVKADFSVIAQPEAQVINLSVVEGSVSAGVVPMFFQRVVYDHVVSNFKVNTLLYKFQSAFMSGFSTDTCLIHLTDFKRMEMDDGYVVGMVLLDLQKVFNTIDHSILLMKLRWVNYGQNFSY